MASVYLSRGFGLFSPNMIRKWSSLRFPSSLIPLGSPRFFSTSKDVPDEQGNALTRWVQEKITHQEQFSFPKNLPFEIEEHEVEDTPYFILKRNVFGENIKVTAFSKPGNSTMQQHFSGMRRYSGRWDYSGMGDHWGKQNEVDVPYVDFSINIHKEEDCYLHIKCFSSEEGLKVEKMCIIKEGRESKTAQEIKVSKREKIRDRKKREMKENEDSNDLMCDEAMQMAALQFLEDRGIDITLAKIIRKCLMKDIKSQCEMLEKMKCFLNN